MASPGFLRVDITFFNGTKWLVAEQVWIFDFLMTALIEHSAIFPVTLSAGLGRICIVDTISRMRNFSVSCWRRVQKVVEWIFLSRMRGCCDSPSRMFNLQALIDFLHFHTPLAPAPFWGQWPAAYYKAHVFGMSELRVEATLASIKGADGGVVSGWLHPDRIRIDKARKACRWVLLPPCSSDGTRGFKDSLCRWRPVRAPDCPQNFQHTWADKIKISQKGNNCPVKNLDWRKN